MAELRFSSRRPNNFAGSGRRVYANPNDFHSDVQTHGWAAKPVALKARVQRNQAGSDNGPQQEGEEERRRPWNERKWPGVQGPDDGLREEFIEFQRKSSKSGSGKGPVAVINGMQDHEQVISSTQVNGKVVQDEVRSAAALLLARTTDFLFVDLCESCSSTLRHRLASIVSGEISASLSTNSSTILATERPDKDRNPGCLNGISEAKVLDTDVAHLADSKHVENGVDDHDDEAESPHAASVADNASKHAVVLKKDHGCVHAPRQEPIGEKRWAAGAAGSNNVTTNLMFKTALRSIQDAPAYRTRNMSRQAVLLQTPDRISESASDSREDGRILEVKRKKDFCFLERVNGQNINILEGLELHSNVFDPAEQQELIDFVYELQELGRNQKLRRRTYSEPRKWMRGKGRVTIQFGCCYNYAVDKEGNPPGIIREEEVDEIPPKLRMVIKRLVQWQVLPSSCIPDSCIVNIYDVGDCIPPHIDHHDFVRPFCTLSLLSECDIVFGTNLRIAGPGEFKGSISIPLPTGSVLILSGNGADVSKHAVPAVPSRRISITFRKMDPTKVPHAFRPDEELLSTQPLVNASHSRLRTPVAVSNSPEESHHQHRTSDLSHFSLESDFPALGRPVPGGRHRNLRS